MRMPRVRIPLLGLMAAVAVAAVVTRHVTDQPKRRQKAIDATARAGGFVQLDGGYKQHQASPRANPTVFATADGSAPGSLMTSRSSASTAHR